MLILFFVWILIILVELMNMEMVANAKAKKILIDHHQFPQGFEDYTYWDDKASSTCELVYRWIKDVEKEQQIDQYIASCLYTGIMTDTGSFRFSNCSADTHQIVANLMHYGVDHVWITIRFTTVLLKIE